MANVALCGALCIYTGAKSSLSIQGDTLDSVLRNLGLSYPAIGRVLFGQTGQLRGHYLVGLDNRIVRPNEFAATRVDHTSNITIYAIMAGG